MQQSCSCYKGCSAWPELCLGIQACREQFQAVAVEAIVCVDKVARYHTDAVVSNTTKRKHSLIKSDAWSMSDASWQVLNTWWSTEVI